MQARVTRRVQPQGGARRSHARRTSCTLSVRSRGPTKRLGPSRGSSTRKGDPMPKLGWFRTGIPNALVAVAAAGAPVPRGRGANAPATAAVTAAQGAIDAVKGEAAKYVPDQLSALESTLASAKASFEKQDYKAALASAQDVAAKAKDLGAAAAAKKAELAKSWEALSG